MKTRTIITMIAVLIIILLSACAGDSSGEAQLEGTSWVLTALNGESPAYYTGTRPYIKFEDGRIFGSSGCNGYAGCYNVIEGAIILCPCDRTKVGCHEQEIVFFDLLEATERFKVADGVLTLFTDDGQNLTFELE
jgi:heat shock protein HslJ